MVKLIQIDRLAPRIEGMLYKCAFEESWSLLDDVGHPQRLITFFLLLFQGARKLSEAGQSLLQAKHFKELLSVSDLGLCLISCLLNHPIVVDIADR